MMYDNHKDVRDEAKAIAGTVVRVVLSCSLVPAAYAAIVSGLNPWAMLVTPFATVVGVVCATVSAVVLGDPTGGRMSPTVADYLLSWALGGALVFMTATCFVGAALYPWRVA